MQNTKRNTEQYTLKGREIQEDTLIHEKNRGGMYLYVCIYSDWKNHILSSSQTYKLHKYEKKRRNVSSNTLQKEEKDRTTHTLKKKRKSTCIFCQDEHRVLHFRNVKTTKVPKEIKKCIHGCTLKEVEVN